MISRPANFLLLVLFACAASPLFAADPAPAPDYASQVAPVLKKYCVGCHNGTDLEGKLSLESFADLQRGGKHGPAVLPGDSKSSRLVRLLDGQSEPRMPPEGNDAPAAAEVAMLRAWVDSGAKGPAGEEPDRRTLLVPKIAPKAGLVPGVTALAWSAQGDLVAVARGSEVQLLRGADLSAVRTLADHPGKVNSLQFSADGSRLIAATGVIGLVGEARAWNVADGQLAARYEGHRDALYAARLSPDGQLLATAGYDRKIILWDVATGKPVRTLEGHNDAVYDLAFSPDGAVLASESGDQTGKIWSTATGQRLDTLSQPLKEQYCIAVRPDGAQVLAAGVDNRIRVWELVSRDKQIINPLVVSRFAHEGPIVRMVFSRDGKLLATAAEDRTLKIWETGQYLQVHAYDRQPDVAAALAFSPDDKRLLVGRLDGSLQAYPVVRDASYDGPELGAVRVRAAEASQTNELAESEPNDSPDQATAVKLPAIVHGVLHRAGAPADVDYFRFQARAGEIWMLETNAARSGSPADTKLAILDESGQPVPRVLLQAVRDSYVDFRGVDGAGRQFRLHNWEEMDLDQYLYCNGEVVKLYLAPRGPDSGFDMYPHGGSRIGYFDTTPMSHPLHQPCYIVEPHLPGTKPPPNGLPAFLLHYENDDDSLRQLSADSRLAFTAPADGTYFVRVTDVRGFSGENFKYLLTIRPPQPDFAVKVEGLNPTVGAGSGREFSVVADRKDGFDGPIRVDITGLPPGFAATTPLVIEAGHFIARGSIHAVAGATAPTTEQSQAVKVTATAQINSVDISHESGSLGEIKLTDRPKLLVHLSPPGQKVETPTAVPAPPEITIAPGQTITATVRVERFGYDGRVQFESLNLNLPHGVIVDNVGLNGVLIPEGQTERTIYLTAAKWVPETSRPFTLKAKEEGEQSSWPMILHVKKP